MTSAIFEPFKPDAEALLRQIAPQIDDAMLTLIAQQDKGRNVEQHRDALRRIRDAGTFELSLSPYPREVLELVRWRPAPAEQTPTAEARRFHWVRAFCCAVLLRASAAPDDSAGRDNWGETLAPLIDSLRALAAGLDQEAAGLLAWLILRFEGEEPENAIGFLGVGLFWFGLQLRTTIADAALVGLADWIVATEIAAAARVPIFLPPWLFRAAGFRHNRPAWQRLGAALQALELSGRGEPVRRWTQLFGRELSEE